MPTAKMSGVNETFVAHREDRRLAELAAMLRRSRPNVLVIGSSADTDRVFEVMYPYLRSPIVAWVPRETRDVPAASFRTLVIRDVDALDSTQQENLVASICRFAANVQIVSTSRTPLFPLVQRGAFLDRLYYQLNVVYLDLTDHDA
jgi:sigma-54-interacting transcriptional regulator